MLKHLRVQVTFIVYSLVLCSVVYPAFVMLFGHTFFPSKAMGSLVVGPDQKEVGSSLIAQEFKGDEWFQPRPSAAGYNGSASGGSNYGAKNQKLRERVEEQLKTAPKLNQHVPSDAVTASGSGLDPHITLSNAQFQQERIVNTWATKTGRDPKSVQMEIETILQSYQFSPAFGIVGGEPLINVLETNFELHRKLTAK